MTGNLLISALGVRVRITCDGLDADEVQAVEDAWRDARVDADDAGPAEVEVAAGTGGGIRNLLSALSQRVTLAAIEAQRGRMWMLHAAGLALPDGRVVALVGPSGRGKTTAARVLGREFGYVSDETVAVDVEGRVHPYRKPLSIIEAGEAEKAQRSPSTLGLRELPDAELRLAGIVLLDRREAIDGAVVEEVDLGDALPDLVAQSSYLTDLLAPLRTIAAHVASAGGILRVTYADVAALVDVLPWLAGSVRRGGETERIPPAASVRHSGGDRGRMDHDGPRWFRTPVHDEIELPDPQRLAVLQVDDAGEGTVRVLAGVAPTLLGEAQAASLDDLIEAAVRAHGRPAGQDAESLVRAALTDLADAGIVEQRAPRWGARGDIAWTGEGDRFVLLSLADPDASPVALEGSAAVIWHCMVEQDADTATLSRSVADRVGVEVAAVAQDVSAFVDELRRAALVERR
ncbi:hypothetical protein B1729_03000 [Microbacterium sp. B35-04]|uniref:PqqD family peptide modification chaperone n=1 Tax=Microbacterium sp. B35-04 TaxID=1961716 RepID=UPI0013CF724F|nr:PqqD family peptide modification chaperone [Microbacterium sp. B35-04]KAF2414814.1 hypothetical protein B1729_03000 [Microbacterium sp. B35-04]